MKRNTNDLAAVVLAGGKGSRMGPLARATPKCLLPIREGQTLLTRLADQLYDAGVEEMVVCCSPENQPAIGSHLQSERADLDAQGGWADAFACSMTRLGPLPALGEAASQVSSSWIVLCLGDIFFRKSPFVEMVKRLTQTGTFDGYLVTGMDETSGAAAGTGWVGCEQGSVKAISYPPFEGTAAWPQVRRWSGAFGFRTELAADLRAHFALYQGTPLERWIERMIADGRHFGWIDGGTFVNVNSVRDYEHLLARTGTLDSDAVAER